MRRSASGTSRSESERTFAITGQDNVGSRVTVVDHALLVLGAASPGRKSAVERSSRRQYLELRAEEGAVAVFAGVGDLFSR